jgi:phosphoglycerate dehydrogenase-like enzyme
MAASPNPRLVVSDFEFGSTDRQRLEAALAPGALLLANDTSSLPDTLRAHPETDVLCTFRPPSDTLTLAPNLRWLAMPSAGADGAVRAGLLAADRPLLITTANGVHTVPITEFVFGALLILIRHWPDILTLQRERTWPDHSRWRRLGSGELDGSTLGVVGLGAIGRQIARIGRAFGMRVVATRRTVIPGATDPDADVLYPTANLRALLAEADFVILAVPHTPETHHLLGPNELRAMKPSAFLVNIARGTIVDEPALIAALQNGTIAGAALDVFEKEPLPPDSPLWTLPNVLISPHVSGLTTRYSHRFTDLFLDNLTRYRAGQPLRNLVDPVRGY